MLYAWLVELSLKYPLLNIFKYITFRSFLAFLTSIILSVIVGKKFIEFMKLKQFGQTIRDDGPQSHLKKSGTPTMGGIFIFISIFISILFFGNFKSSPFLFTLVVFLSYFFLGFTDDYLKVLKKNTKGVIGKVKLLWQFSTAFFIMYFLLKNQVIDTNLYVPFFKDFIIDLGFWGYLIFGSFVIVGSSNAVNLTDGLDGLAIGPIIISASTLGLLAYVSGHKEIAQYLYIPHISGSGELVVFAAAVVGAGAGFLWYNAYPAQIFMGDVGSLSLGGVLGTISVITKNELLFVIIGGIFVIEALSVILQVGSYKLRKKRIFKMAPIHHHFELKGWPETKVIVRFWIISLVLAILAIATLKIR